MYCNTGDIQFVGWIWIGLASSNIMWLNILEWSLMGTVFDSMIENATELLQV